MSGDANSPNGARVSVLVPVLNEEADLERTMEGVLAQRLDGRIEVLVMEGGSTDTTPQILERLARGDSRIRVLLNPHGSIPAALNIGLAHARGEYVARMDAHTRYPPDYLAHAMRRFAAGDVACVSGPQLPQGDGRWSRRIALALGTRLGVGGAAFRNATRELEVDTGFTGVWRRRTLIDVGGWDERWPINEDAELAARIRERGGRYVCLPDMAALYVPRRSLRALARQYWRYGIYREKTARHHPIGLRASHVLPPGVVLALLAAAAPGTIGRVARRGLVAYAAALVAGTAEVATKGEGDPGDLAALPLVYGVMHVSWGGGFLLGCLRYGPPFAAVGHAFGLVAASQADPGPASEAGRFA